MATDWQARFQALAVQQEEDERRFAEAERTLCRTVVRLCTACHGFDQLLDPHLDSLKRSVKDGYQPALAQRLQILGDALVSADQQRGEHDLAERLVRRLGWTGKRARQLRDAWVRVEKNPAGASDQELDLLVVALGLQAPDSNVAEGQPTKRSGLLGRLLGGGEAGERPPNTTLAELLARIQWPDSVVAEIGGLREELGEGAPADTWVSVVERLGDLVIKVLQDSQAQVAVAEAFLAELGERLGAIDAHVSGEAGDRDAARDRGEQLSVAMQGEMEELTDNLHSSTDLAQLKQHVSASLDRLQQHVTGYLDADRCRHQDAVEREAALREEMALLEAEADKLRDQISRNRDQANTDPLTGLPNRRAWDARLADELARFKRFGQPLSLVVFDLDNFKQINDRFGHKAGDKALKVIATLLGKGLRGTDFLARYGGEEFVLLLPGAEHPAAYAVADKLRAAVADAGLHSKGEPVPLTLSGGVAQVQPDESADAVFERADQAMYRAKAAGKNQVVAD